MSVMKTSGRVCCTMRRASSPERGAGDDLDVVFHFEQRGERAEDHGLVFGKDDADLVALGAGAMPSVSQSRGAGARGKSNYQAGSVAG